MRSLVIITLLLSFSTAMASYQAFNTATGEILNLAEFVEQIPNEGYLVLGETHYNEAVQRAQADIIRDVNLLHGLAGDFSVAMEFLNHPAQAEISKSMAEFVKFGGPSFKELLALPHFSTFGKYESSQSYEPIFNALKMYGGNLVALNAPRDWRREVRTKGYNNIEKARQIPNMWVGDDNYFELFVAAMGGHGDPAMFKSYFDAQCYVDSVMSYTAFKNYNNSYQFIVAGEFHTNYGYGTVARLKRLTATPVVSLQIVDVRDLTTDELNEVLTPDANHGATADYIILAQ